MPSTNKRPVDNSIYERLGDRWQTACDDPIALLRAESKAILGWLLEKFSEGKVSKGATVLDVGCGGGFLANPLAAANYAVTGLDLSPESLASAARFDATGRVKYVLGNAYQLPFEAGSFDVVTCMDFLEHVEDPDKVVSEIARVLKPGGRFYFHTFNRNPVAHLVIIKLVEWFVKNTPKDMHVIHLFLKPQEVKKICAAHGLSVNGFLGLRPKFRSIPLKNFFTGIVPETLRFETCKSTLLSYVGDARKGS